MSPRLKALIIAVIIALLPVFVSGCGYKDDLYLDNPDKPKKKAEPGLLQD